MPQYISYGTTTRTLIPPGAYDLDGNLLNGTEAGTGPSKVIVYWALATFSVPASTTSTYIQLTIKDTDAVGAATLTMQAEPITSTAAHRKSVFMDFGSGQVFDIRGANDANPGVVVLAEDDGNASVVNIAVGYDWI